MQQSHTLRGQQQMYWLWRNNVIG